MGNYIYITNKQGLYNYKLLKHELCCKDNEQSQCNLIRLFLINNILVALIQTV